MSKPRLRSIGDYEYDEQYCVGVGSFGKVFRAKQVSTGLTVAVKKIDSDMINQQQYLRDALEAEIQILKSLDHQNIVKFIDQFNTDRSIYIATEFCDGGDLKDLMKNAIVPEMEVFEIFCQIIDGMEYLVKKNIIHRDLKPANILIHDKIMKIADFGFAKSIENFNGKLLQTCVGSPLYMSPQILNGKPYTTQSDIWSLGIIYYEMLFNQPPWNGKNEQGLKDSLRNNDLCIPTTPEISQESRTFLTKALQKEEASRISWEETFALFAEIKDKYKIQTKTQVVKSFDQQLKENNSVRLQLSFTYFANVEMIQNLILLKDYCQWVVDFDNLCMFLAKIVSVKYQNCLEKINSLLNTQNKLTMFQTYLETIQEESKLAHDLLKYILNQFQMCSEMDNLLSKYEIEQLEQLVKIKIHSLAQGILDNQKTSYEVLCLLDYMLETLITKKQLQNNENINYRKIHDKLQFKDNLEQFIETIRQKVSLSQQ